MIVRRTRHQADALRLPAAGLLSITGPYFFLMAYKQPRSVQVVIFADTACGREYLLLRRSSAVGGFWQFVTGSLEADETHRQAAVREVCEETGIPTRESDLIDLKLTNNFQIAAEWRAKYAPGVSENEEVCFALKVDKCEVALDPAEHEAYLWVTGPTALDMLYWQSNKRALAALDDLECVSERGKNGA
jgi:dATP pyrophosphohydrolase